MIHTARIVYNVFMVNIVIRNSIIVDYIKSASELGEGGRTDSTNRFCKFTADCSAISLFKIPRVEWSSRAVCPNESPRVDTTVTGGNGWTDTSIHFESIVYSYHARKIDEKITAPEFRIRPGPFIPNRIIRYLHGFSCRGANGLRAVVYTRRRDEAISSYQRFVNDSRDTLE